MFDVYMNDTRINQMAGYFSFKVGGYAAEVVLED